MSLSDHVREQRLRCEYASGCATSTHGYSWFRSAPRADGHGLIVDNGEHCVGVLQTAFEVAVTMLDSSDELGADRRCVLPSSRERVVRTSGPKAKALIGTAGDLLDATTDSADVCTTLER